MEAHIYDWLHLLLRWIHFIVGVAWIGASFYFNWLENNLDRSEPQEEGIAGNLWAVHGGGFYYLKKFKRGPEKLPTRLHWFKWEAYTTWLSGVSLLVVVYYSNASLYLMDASVSDIGTGVAIAIGLGSMLLSWLVYDGLCKSPLRHKPVLLALLIFLGFVLLAWGLSQWLSPRAAYIHVGAAIGTIMVANVFFTIIPAQKEMVSALQESRELDPRYGASGLLRSRHNNYLTLPVLFVMISSHFPATYGHAYSWLVLAAVSLVGIVARHYFNIRHLRANMIWLLPAAFAGLLGIMWATAPTSLSGPNTQANVTDNQVFAVVSQRCASCHAAKPSQPGFILPPLGIELDSVEKMQAQRDNIYRTTVTTQFMPLGNLTGMLPQERLLVQQWVESQ